MTQKHRLIWGTTDGSKPVSFNLVLSLAALVVLAKSIPVYSLILFSISSSVYPFTQVIEVVFANPENIEMWLNHLSVHFLTSYSPMAALVFIRASEVVTWSIYEHGPCTRYTVAFGSISSQKARVFSLTLLLKCTNDSQVYRIIEI